MRLLRKVLVAAVFVGLLVAGWKLANDNAKPVQVNYVVGSSPDLPLWQVLLGATALGGLLCAVPMGFVWARARLETRRYRRELRKRERELLELRGGDGEPVSDGQGETGADAPAQGGDSGTA